MVDVAVPTFKKRTNKAGNARKRPATPPPEASEQSESDYTDDEDGVRIKRRRKEGVSVGATIKQSSQDLSKSTKYGADRSSTISVNDFATKTSNLYAGESTTTNQQERERNNTNEDDDAELREGTYKGAASYGSFIQKSANAPVRKVGPMKAPTNVRTITTTDFAPDVCKDYKQTGFCGFGDGCKFLHAREDYAQGWQLDREWEKAGKTTKGTAGAAAAPDTAADDGDEAKLLESIPFKCIICKEDYTRPVVTRCGHYFCEKCAMQRYMREKKRTCANCGADTNGTFNVARKLKELLEKKKRRAKERAEAEEEAEKTKASADA